jgi:hypothetical protein
MSLFQELVRKKKRKKWNNFKKKNKNFKRWGNIKCKPHLLESWKVEVNNLFNKKQETLNFRDLFEESKKNIKTF